MNIGKCNPQYKQAERKKIDTTFSFHPEKAFNKIQNCFHESPEDITDTKGHTMT